MSAKKKPRKNDAMLGALAASFGNPKPLTEDAANARAETSEPVEKGREVGPTDPPTAPALTAPKPDPSTTAVLPVPVPRPVAEKEDPRPLPDNLGVKKTTVSFHPAEQDKIDRILDALLHSRRHRGGFSDAIKIALRLCPIDSEEIATAWDLARAQDLRIARHRKSS